jgi:tRNA (cytosine38-C5)-methyltransferase
LSPNQLGIPNSRLRYYLLARNKNQKSFVFEDENEIINKSDIFKELGIVDEIIPPLIKDFMSLEEPGEEFYLPDKLLNKESSMVMDLATFESNNTNCFTKAYGRLLKGTGSIFLTDKELYGV